MKKLNQFCVLVLLAVLTAALLTGCVGRSGEKESGDPSPSIRTEQGEERKNTAEDAPSAAASPLPAPESEGRETLSEESEPPAVEQGAPPVESEPPAMEQEVPPVESEPPAMEQEAPPEESEAPVEASTPPVEENVPSEPPVSDPVAEETAAEVTRVEDVKLEDEAVAMSEAPAAVPESVSAEASGTQVKENSDAVIDYSNLSDGYVMVQHKTAAAQRLKVQVKGPTTTYTYNLTAQQWEVFPLSDGNGAYQITVYRNVTGNKYASVISLTTNVALKSEFAPFLHSNQYVDYDSAPNTVAKASELLGNVSDPLKKVEVVYDYVVKGMSYDKELAATVKSGYLPVLDTVLKKMSGICFDYAALMTGMLRSQGVPCKLVVGYAGTAYHAWISVWVEGSGWVDGVIWFNGASWQRMDPTFASSSDSESILDYIGDGANYSAKYFY